MLQAIAIGLLAVQTATADDHLDWNPQVSLPIVLGTGITWGLLYTTVEDDLSPRGQTSDPSGIDALVEPRFEPGTGKISDVLLYGTIGGGLVAGSLSNGLDSSSAAVRAGIMAEVFCANAITTELVKLAVRRPRPYTALDPEDWPGLEEELASVDSEMSFPSGHTSHVAAMAVGAARLQQLTDAPSSRIWAGYAGAAALGTSAAMLRVKAGVHHPSDVVAGAAIGAAAGWLVPTLHRRTAGNVAVNGNGVSYRTVW
jgi:membrane-associated phospholipid phosphatase